MTWHAVQKPLSSIVWRIQPFFFSLSLFRFSSTPLHPLVYCWLYWYYGFCAFRFDLTVRPNSAHVFPDAGVLVIRNMPLSEGIYLYFFFLPDSVLLELPILTLSYTLRLCCLRTRYSFCLFSLSCFFLLHFLTFFTFSPTIFPRRIRSQRYFFFGLFSDT